MTGLQTQCHRPHQKLNLTQSSDKGDLNRRRRSDTSLCLGSTALPVWNADTEQPGTVRVAGEAAHQQRPARVCPGVPECRSGQAEHSGNAHVRLQ
eukprot:COSAG02_NODE_1849_length_10679_cov_7.150945_6_plen_95_part_00